MNEIPVIAGEAELAIAEKLAKQHVADLVDTLNEETREEAARAIQSLPFERAVDVFDQPGLDLVYDAVTTTAARVLGVPDHRLEPGGAADLVVHEHASVREVLAHHAPPVHVIASGKVVT